MAWKPEIEIDLKERLKLKLDHIPDEDKNILMEGYIKYRHNAKEHTKRKLERKKKNK